MAEAAKRKAVYCNFFKADQGLHKIICAFILNRINTHYPKQYNQGI